MCAMGTCMCQAHVRVSVHPVGSFTKITFYAILHAMLPNVAYYTIDPCPLF